MVPRFPPLCDNFLEESDGTNVFDWQNPVLVDGRVRVLDLTHGSAKGGFFLGLESFWHKKVRVMTLESSKESSVIVGLVTTRNDSSIHYPLHFRS